MFKIYTITPKQALKKIDIEGNMGHRILSSTQPSQKTGKEKFKNKIKYSLKN